MAKRKAVNDKGIEELRVINDVWLHKHSHEIQQTGYCLAGSVANEVPSLKLQII